MDHHIGVLERSTEEGLDEASPVLLLTGVGCSHVVEVHIGDLLLLLPLVSSGDHLLDPRAIHTVDTTEDTHIGQCTGLLGGEALLYEFLLCIDRPLGDIVLFALLALAGNELYGLSDEGEA